MKKIISLFMVVLMVFSTAAIPGFAEKSKTTAETELSELTELKIPKTVRTKKTKFGKTINSNPIKVMGTNEDWKIYSVEVVKVDLLQRYAKKTSKIQTSIEFVSRRGFYFYTNCPGNYSLEIKFKGPSGKIYNFSENYLTQVYVPDSKYSFTKGSKNYPRFRQNLLLCGRRFALRGLFTKRSNGWQYFQYSCTWNLPGV